MPESMSWAIATQQAHATGKAPKKYGTPEGKQEAKKKYDAPKGSYEMKSDPPAEKNAGLGKLLAPIKNKSDERTRQLIREELEKSKVVSVDTPPMMGKLAGISTPLSAPFIAGFRDELAKIANIGMTQPVLGEIKTTTPRPTVGAGKYSKVNSSPSDSPIARHQPVLEAPPVRR